MHTSPMSYQGKVFAADMAGKLIAFQQNSGQELWKSDLDVGFSISVPTVTENIIIVASSKGILYGVNKDNGKPLW